MFSSMSEVAEDEDVVAEKALISREAESLSRENPVVIRGLTKYFGNHRAVDDIHLSIPRGECFGLLGE